MDDLPHELNDIIFSYLFKCKKNRDYIVNKETLNIFNNITSDCEKIFVFRKNVCKKCDKKTIMYLRLMMNNLITSF